MNSILKSILVSYFIGFCFLPLWGQNKLLDKPPSQENTYLFTILRYNRQPKIPSYIQNRISQILQNPESNWTAQDSLYYAYKSVCLQKFALALSIFSRLNTDTIKEPNAQSLYRATLQNLGRYEKLKEYNERTLLDDSSKLYSIKDAYMDLTEAYITYNKMNFIPDSNKVFPILYQEQVLKKINRKAPPYKNKIVQIAFAVDSAFRQFTFLHDKKDIVLSKAFEEMGDFQKEYLYLTNSFFYYAGALHYNRTNKLVIEKYNRAIDAMTDHNYLSISFKHKFGKVIKNRYDKKKNLIQDMNIDSISTRESIPPSTNQERKDYLPWLNNSVLVIIIIAAVLIFVLVFVKTKK